MLTREFDFQAPDYPAVFEARTRLLRRIRKEPGAVPKLRAFYKANPADFISDWGCTFEPRNIERGLPALIPFVLFPRQVEWVGWVVDCWRNQRSGITEKTRDMGMSWLAVSLACGLCLHYDGMSIGFGSRKEEYVDKADSPKSLFWKARIFMANLPREFRGGWEAGRDAPHMRLRFPETDSYINGEAGDNIGRGDRQAIYFVDEAAFLERPQLVEASLAATTNSRQDISTPNGMANPFATKRHGGKLPVFTFHWREDPRKGEAWYAKQVDDLDARTLAAEVNIDYSASVEGVLIPSAWVQAAVDAHRKLGIEPTGARCGALDVADEGDDTNAFCGAHGVLIERVDEWSGKGSDIYATVLRAFGLCDEQGYELLKFDADGLGAGVKGDARAINEGRTQPVAAEAFRGSAGVFRPDAEDVKGRKNADYFANAKAQSWWALRRRFQQTYRAVAEGMEVPADDIIAIPAELPLRVRLVSELSQPTYSVTSTGKIIVDKTPNGARSPNLADACMIRFSSAHRAPMWINPEALLRAATAGVGGHASAGQVGERQGLAAAARGLRGPGTRG